MLPELAHAIIELADDAFSGDIVQIRLTVSRVDILHATLCRLIRYPGLECGVSNRVLKRDRIP